MADEHDKFEELRRVFLMEQLRARKLPEPWIAVVLEELEVAQVYALETWALDSTNNE